MTCRHSGIEVNGGRYLKNEVDGQASAEFGIGWASDSERGRAIRRMTRSAFLLPAVRVSAWEMIGDYFGLMGGIGFTHAMFDHHRGRFGRRRRGAEAKTQLPPPSTGRPVCSSSPLTTCASTPVSKRAT